MSGNDEKLIPISKREYDLLCYVRRNLLHAIKMMMDANDFQELASGYGAETYRETIENLIDGIEDYLRRSPIERES